MEEAYVTIVGAFEARRTLDVPERTSPCNEVEEVIVGKRGARYDHLLFASLMCFPDRKP